MKALILAGSLIGIIQDHQAEQLIAKFENSNFEVRARATRELLEMGPAILSKLRKVKSSQRSLEGKFRLDRVITRIESQFPHKLTIKQTLLKLPKNNNEIIKAKYLLVFCRMPTDLEFQNELKRIQVAKDGTEVVDTLMEDVWSTTVAPRIILKDMSKCRRLAPTRFFVGNSTKSQELLFQISERFCKCYGHLTLRQRVDTVFLLLLFRFPCEYEGRLIENSLREGKENRIKDVFWVLINTKEFAENCPVKETNLGPILAPNLRIKGGK